MIHESLLQDLSLWACLWQSMVFISLGLVASYLLRRRPSRAYQVLLFAMIAPAVVPLMSAMVKHFDLGVFAARATESLSTPLKGREAIPFVGTDDLAGIAVPVAAAPASINSGPAETTSAWRNISWRAVAVYGWMIATLALLARLIVTFMYGAYIVRSAQRSGCEQVQQAVNDVTLKLGLSCGLQVRSSRRVRSPIVWCWSRRPILLVPNDTGAPRVEWSGVVSHELAHCKRWDHITGLIAELMVCLLPWNPLMWLSKKCLVRLGEQACDDWVVAAGQPSEDYAESLLHFRPQRQMAFLPAVVHSKKGLASRIDRILKDSCGNPRTGAAWALAVSIVVTCLSIGIAFAQTRPAKPEAAAEESPKPTKLLHHAARDGDVEQVKLNIRAGVDIDARDVDIDPRDTGGWGSALHYAVVGGHTAVVEVLISAGADVNVKDLGLRSPLAWAAQEGHTDIIQLLLARGAEVNAKDKWDLTPLHKAVRGEKQDLAQLLISKGADVNAKDNWGITPIATAMTSRESNPETVELLLQAGARVPALHLAAYRGNIAEVTRLLQQGMDVDARGDFPGTALHMAVAGGHKQMALLLIGKGADLNAKGLGGWTPLHVAVVFGYRDTIELLIAEGADVNAKGSQDETPLHWAAAYGPKPIVELLITKGADINMRSTHGATVLGKAASGGQKDVVELLIELLIAKGLVDGKSGSWLPLHQAIWRGHNELAEFLIMKGADINATGPGGTTPLTLAIIQQPDQEAVKLLIAKGADVNGRDESGQTPLHVAVIQSRLDIAEILIAKGANVNAQDNEGRTPLRLAKEKGQDEVVELLRKHGAKEE